MAPGTLTAHLHHPAPFEKMSNKANIWAGMTSFAQCLTPPAVFGGIRYGFNLHATGETIIPFAATATASILGGIIAYRLFSEIKKRTWETELKRKNDAYAKEYDALHNKNITNAKFAFYHSGSRGTGRQLDAIQEQSGNPLRIKPQLPSRHSIPL